MRATACVVAMVAACYSPRVQLGAPCDPSSPSCPDGQTCEQVAGSYVCTTGPGTPIDAEVDTSRPIDAPPDARPDASIDAPPPRWTLVQTIDTTNGSISVTPTGAGNTIIVALQLSDANIATAVADSAGNTYTRIAASRATVTNSDLAVEFWYARGVHAGATSITPTASPLYSIVVWEVAGLRATGAVDAAAALNDQSMSTTPVGASVTTTQTGDFVVGVAMVANSVSGIHAGNAFTNDHTTHQNGWAHLADAAAPPGTYFPQWDQPMSGGFSASTVAFFVGP